MRTKLLIVTQKVDKDDPILGFFHGWIEQISKEVSEVTVICLEYGVFSLPSNVTVLSLGKEVASSKLTRIFRLFKYAWRERKNYSTVFVHMNQEYVVLAGLLWKMLGKKILLWRNHAYGNFLTRIAVAFADRVYCTSTHSYTAQFQKTVLMPAGIDTAHFKKAEKAKVVPHSVLYLGRVSRIKRPDILVDAIELLWERDIDVHVSIVGDPTPDSVGFYEKLRAESVRLEETGAVRFFDAVLPEMTPALYNTHEMYVNLTNSGSFDKTVLEAMACERPVVISNLSFKRLVPEPLHELVFFSENDAEDLAKKIKRILTLPAAAKREFGRSLRETVVHNQSLERLVAKLVKDFK